MENNVRSRPLGVTVIAAVTIIEGILLLIFGGAGLAGIDFNLRLRFVLGFLGYVGNDIVRVALGIVTLAIGIGLFIGQKIAWFSSIALWGLDAILYLIFSFGLALFVSLAILVEVSLIAYLLRYEIQKYFRVDIHWHW